jgi:hypothetical protein
MTWRVVEGRSSTEVGSGQGSSLGGTLAPWQTWGAGPVRRTARRSNIELAVLANSHASSAPPPGPRNPEARFCKVNFFIAADR